jgi:hypothetical protein
MPNSPQPKTWRDVLPIHPAADLFPRMSESELRELGEDIKANGLRASIVLYKGKQLLDGRNRLDAMELVGIKFAFMRQKNKFVSLYACDGSNIFNAFGRIEHFDGGPYAFVLSANIHRRHLTAELKRDLIEKLLKAKPEQSDRQIAQQTKTSPTTVGKIRKKSEATGDVSKLDTRTDTKGRKQAAHKSTNNTPSKRPEILESEPTSTEIAVEPPRLRKEDQELESFIAVVCAVCVYSTYPNIKELRIPKGLTAEKATECVGMIEQAIKRFHLLKNKLTAIAQSHESQIDVPQGSAEVSIEQRKSEHAALDRAAP